MLRTHARQATRKITDMAEAVVTSHLLLPATLGHPRKVLRVIRLPPEQTAPKD